jgi:hypothetical protein
LYCIDDLRKFFVENEKNRIKLVKTEDDIKMIENLEQQQQQRHQQQQPQRQVNKENTVSSTTSSNNKKIKEEKSKKQEAITKNKKKDISGKGLITNFFTSSSASLGSSDAIIPLHNTVPLPSHVVATMATIPLLEPPPPPHTKKATVVVEPPTESTLINIMNQQTTVHLSCVVDATVGSKSSNISENENMHETSSSHHKLKSSNNQKLLADSGHHIPATNVQKQISKPPPITVFYDSDDSDDDDDEDDVQCGQNDVLIERHNAESEIFVSEIESETLPLDDEEFSNHHQEVTSKTINAINCGNNKRRNDFDDDDDFEDISSIRKRYSSHKRCC